MPAPTLPTLLAALLLAAAPAAAGDDPPRVSEPDPALADDPRFGLLNPIPATGGVPPIVAMLDRPAELLRARQAVMDRYRTEFRRLRREHFGSIRAAEIRAAGCARLREYADTLAFPPMIEVMSTEGADVRAALLAHLETQGDVGQAAIAWAAIHPESEPMRRAALDRLVAPACPEVLGVLDEALRSNVHRIANNAGQVAGALNAIETIPLLIFGQATRDPVGEGGGDIAWIAIQTQQAYVQNLAPVVGNNAGAFQPVIGVVTEGTVLRVRDAVAIVYRTFIHESLVAMTSAEWGRSTASLGYDMGAWWHWYNEEYLPFRNEQVRRRAAIEAP